MDKQISVKVENLIPTLLNDIEIVCGNSGYTIKFTFDEEWNKYNVKTALFVCGGVTYDSVFEGDTCKVPAIEKGASCYIGVVSGNVKDTSLPPDKVTTTWAIVNVKESITSIAQEPQDPTPDIYGEFMALLNKYIEQGGGGTGGGSGEATKVTVNGEFVETFDADTKATRMNLINQSNNGDGFIPCMMLNGDGIERRYNVHGAYVGAYSIPMRVDRGRLFVGEPTEPSNATTKKYVDTATAPIADHEKRIENLESVLLTYTEDTTKAYEKVVPDGVGTLAVLNSIGGASYASKNLYNPKGGQFAVNEDGSIHIVTEPVPNGPTRVTLPSITLNAGTYYVSCEANPNISIDALYFYFEDGDAELNPTILTLDKTTTIAVTMDFDGTGFTEVVVFDLYVMVSKEDIPFEPFSPKLRDTKTTAFVSKDKSGNIIDTYTIPEDIQSLDNYGKEYTYVDFDNKQFVDNSYTVVLTGNELMGGYKYGNNVGVIIGNTNTYPYGPDGSGATNTPYVSNDITLAWVARYGQLWWLNALTAYGYNENWVDKTNPTTEESNASIAQLKMDLAKRYADGNPVVLTYKVGEGKTTDISQHLTDYEDFKDFKCQAGGTVIFENEHKLAVPSTLTYVKKRS